MAKPRKWSLDDLPTAVSKLENLRFLCPNCSFTLDTYGARNWKNLKSRVA